MGSSRAPPIAGLLQWLVRRRCVADGRGIVPLVSAGWKPAQLLSILGSSVELERQTEGVVDGLEFIEAHAANKFAESLRSYCGRLFDEYLCCFAVERDGRTKGAPWC